MFDVGFSELMIIGIVAMVVLGPEKLPRVARTIGALMGRFQRYVNDVKEDIKREVDLDELRKAKDSVENQARDVQNSIRASGASIENDINRALEDRDPSKVPTASDYVIPALRAKKDE